MSGTQSHNVMPGDAIMEQGRTLSEWATIRENVKEDPNYVHPREKRALQELKEKYPIASDPFCTEKILYIFLFARKLDVQRTAELLERHIKWRKENNFLRTPHYREVPESIFNSGYTYPGQVGDRDLKGRGVVYIRMGKFQPKDYPPGAAIRQFVWAYDFSVARESLDLFREGVTYIESIEGAGLSNMLEKKEQNQLMDAVQNNFPIRISSILIVNAGIIVKVLLKIASLFMKEKIIKRVQCIDKEALTEYVDPQVLAAEWGGENDWTFEDYVQSVKDADEQTRQLVNEVHESHSNIAQEHKDPLPSANATAVKRGNASERADGSISLASGDSAGDVAEYAEPQPDAVPSNETALADSDTAHLSPH